MTPLRVPRASLLALYCVLIALSPTARAFVESNGTLDTTFDLAKFSNGEVDAIAIQPDGKILIGGMFAKVNGVLRGNMARVNADGTLDPSFAPFGGTNGPVNVIKLQADGKIIIAGFFSQVSGVDRAAGLARLNPDGSLDGTFNPDRVISLDGVSDASGNATAPGGVTSVILQPGTGGEKIVVAGHFFYIITGPSSSHVARSCVARFLNDGTFDPSFDPGAGFVRSASPSDTFVNTAVAQSTGRIVLGGNFDLCDGNAVPAIARLKADGAYDAGFNPGRAAGGVEIPLLFAQADDRIVVAGNFTTFNAAPHDGMARMFPDGATDQTFNVGTLRDYADFRWPTSIAQQSDGLVLIAGPFHSLGGAPANGVARLHFDGSRRDTTFNSSAATGPNGYGASVAVLPADAGVLVGGYFSSFNGATRNNIAQAKPDGSLDSTFDPPGGATDWYPQVLALGTQSDGKVIAGGVFSSVNGESHYNLLRFNIDGSIDNTFAVGQGTSRSVRALQMLPGDKILIAGNFGGVNGVQRMHTAILNPDGSLDSSFDPGNGPDDVVRSAARDAAGNVYIRGPFNAVNSVVRHNLAKLTPTGAVDLGFDPGTGPAPEFDVGNTILAPSGGLGLLIGGSFTSYNGTPVGHLARIDPSTGTLDAAFTSASGSGFNGVVRALARTPSGKYMVGGAFSSYNGTACARVARVKSDGTLDTSFVPSPAPVGTVRTLAVQGSKTFGGGFITAPTNSVIRLLNDGSADPAFNTGSGVSIVAASPFALDLAEVRALALAPDGKLLIGGTFNDYNGTTRICLARLTGPTAGTVSISRMISLGMILHGIGVPRASYVVEAAPTLFSTFQEIGRVQAGENGEWTFQDTSAAQLNQRFYRLAPE